MIKLPYRTTAAFAVKNVKPKAAIIARNIILFGIKLKIFLALQKFLMIFDDRRKLSKFFFDFRSAKTENRHEIQ